MAENYSKDNKFIYLAKFIACMFVIVIHTRFGGTFGKYADAVARFAVPFFFAASGRFLLSSHDGGVVSGTDNIRRKTGASLLHLILVTVFVWLVYLIFSIVYHLAHGVSLLDWAGSKFNRGEAFNFFLFNSGRFIYDESYTFDHLWFLFALIYVYALIWIFAPVLRKWYNFLIIGLLLLLYFGEALQTYYPIRPFGINISVWFVMRNWLFVGIPFVLLGIRWADYVTDIKSRLSDEEYRGRMSKLKPPAIATVIGGAVLSCIETDIFGKKEVYIGSLIIVTGLFVLSECDINCGKRLWRYGKSSSADIYYYHVLLIAIFDILTVNGMLPEMPMSLKPIIIMVLSFALFAALMKRQIHE